MGQQAKKTVEIDDFVGLVSNVSPEDTPPGAGDIQVNAASLHPGELTVRGGWREIYFETN